MGGYSMQRRQDQHWEAQGILTFYPLLACTGLYVLTAAGFLRDGNGPMAVAFGGYALANVGFLWLTWR
jgi:hypothetical protein